MDRKAISSGRSAAEKQSVRRMILGEIGAAAAAAAAADAETFSITAAAAADDDDDVDEPSGLWMTGARRLSDVPSARLTRLSHPYRQQDTLVS